MFVSDDAVFWDEDDYSTAAIIAQRLLQHIDEVFPEKSIFSEVDVETMAVDVFGIERVCLAKVFARCFRDQDHVELVKLQERAVYFYLSATLMENSTFIEMVG